MYFLLGFMMVQKMRDNLNYIAEKVIEQLRGKVIIHRYDAYTTSSIYLKFDFGVANSLRISDHYGKRYLKYRYNILTTQKGKAVKKDCGYERIYYSPDMVNAVCRDILAAKEAKKNRYKDYDGLVKRKSKEVYHERGFWTQAVEIK